jgi:hypothetical protein
MKPLIFLGSSANNLTVLKKVSDYFSDIADCRIWTLAFARNKSNLDSLIKQTKVADFSIMLAMKEDLLEKKGQVHEVARDNVIFEFGLFLGSSSIYKSFLLAEEGIDLPSDLDGITVDKFVVESGKFNSLDVVCSQIKEAILAQIKMGELGFLPSTALALGYYYNFIYNVCETIHNTGKVQGESKEYEVKDFKFNVIIPKGIDDKGIDVFKSMYYRKNNLNNGSTGTTTAKRGYPFVFKIDPPDQDDTKGIEIQLYDVPGTLNTIIEAIKLFMPQEQVGRNAEVEFLEEREIANFGKVLNHLIGRNQATRNNVIVHQDIVLD